MSCRSKLVVSSHPWSSSLHAGLLWFPLPGVLLILPSIQLKPLFSPETFHTTSSAPTVGNRQPRSQKQQKHQARTLPTTTSRNSPFSSLLPPIWLSRRRVPLLVRAAISIHQSRSSLLPDILFSFPCFSLIGATSPSVLLPFSS